MSIEELIASKNLKLTHARREILEILANAVKPVSYEEIKKDLSMDKATFYRNITKFAEKKIINSFELNDRRRYYEIQQIPHAHFICTICNSVECINKVLDIDLDGYKIENVIIKGICVHCISANQYSGL